MGFCVAPLRKLAAKREKVWIIYIFAIVSYISREMWGGYEVIDCVKDKVI